MGSLPAMKKAGQEGRYHELFLSWTAQFGKIFRLHIPFVRFFLYSPGSFL